MATPDEVDQTLPRLCRGEPFKLRISTIPVSSFFGKTVEVHLDSPTGTRTTLGEIIGTGTGTGEGFDGVYHSTDETYVEAEMWTTENLDDGADYHVSIIVDGNYIGLLGLPVFTPSGGPI